MSNAINFNVAVISDLHLGRGRSFRTKKFQRNEDFFFEGQFDRFLRYLESEAERRGRNWRLIIAGDMVDFLEVTCTDNPAFSISEREKEYGLGTSPEKTIWKMKVMMDGHQEFFRALGRFLSNGNKCAIIPGNHDIEWAVPEVQNAFKEEMKVYLPQGVTNGQEIVSNRIEFFPWFYYEPGLIWVEHGHQYDGINSFDYLLYPYLPKSRELMLPGGSFFVRYLLNKVEQKDPFADNIKPISAYIRKYLLSLLCSAKVMKHVGYFIEIFRKVKKFSDDELRTLEQKNEDGIKKEAARFQLDLKRLKAIQRLWVPCFLYNENKWKNLWRFFTYTECMDLARKAPFIQEQLQVRLVIQGHTHETDLLVLSGDQRAEYVNSGTWTKIFSSDPGERLLRQEQESLFVQVLKDEGDKMELMRWKDEIGQGERVCLFE